MKLARRTFLRGAGAAIALPTLEAMLNGSGTAFADGQAIPKRFVGWFFGNGVILNKWNPANTGTNWALSEQLAPLTDAARGIDVKSYVNVVSGCEIKTPNLRGHHNGVCAMFSAAPFIPIDPNGAGYASKFSVKSIDQVIADSIGTSNTLKSIQIAVSKRITFGEGPTLGYLSHRGPDAPMPQTTNPVALFNALFGNFNPKDPTDPRDRMRASVLDAVKEDAKDLQRKLGTVDKQRLDAHLTAIAETRQRILALPPVVTSACVKPGAPTLTNADVGGVEPIEAVSNVMSDLLALAFACDLTRVATFQFSGSVGGQCYSFLNPGQPRDNEHAITHDATLQNKVNDSVIFTMRCFAYTLHKLKTTMDGTGNVLDSSVVMCTTDVSEGLTHGISDYPILLAGKAQGFLKYPGIHYRSTTARNSSDAVLTAVQGIMPTTTSVGAMQGQSSNPIAELKA